MTHFIQQLYSLRLTPCPFLIRILLYLAHLLLHLIHLGLHLLDHYRTLRFSILGESEYTGREVRVGRLESNDRLAECLGAGLCLPFGDLSRVE